MDTSEIGNVIKYHRKQAGLSRIALALYAGIGKTAIYDIEHGEKTVKLDTLLKIFTALNIKIKLDSPLMEFYEKSKSL